MSKQIVWLHLSDIHFRPATEWRNSTVRNDLLRFLGKWITDHSLRIDLIFCTGDIAFGELKGQPLQDQYRLAHGFFDQLLDVCGQSGKPLPKDRLFVVPGNHDIDRDKVTRAMQESWVSWGAPNKSREMIKEIHEWFAATGNREIQCAMERLGAYGDFVREYLPHQQSLEGHHYYANEVNIDGVRVGVAGFNSAWTSFNDTDDRKLWLATDPQFNAAREMLKDSHIRIGLIHHPLDWFNVAERERLQTRIAQDVDFWLHGHAHDPWLHDASTHVTIGSGAVGGDNDAEYGVNLTKIDLDLRTGIVHLFSYATRHGRWDSTSTPGRTVGGITQFRLPTRLSSEDAKPTTVEDMQAVQPATLPVSDAQSRGVFGRDRLIAEVAKRLEDLSIALLYGMVGNGKTTVISELALIPPLAGKEAIRIAAHPDLNANELYRHLAAALGNVAEHPQAPVGSPDDIARFLHQSFPQAKPAWLWIDKAHQILDGQDFLRDDVRNLLLGLSHAFPDRWKLVLEMRERPPTGILGAGSFECEIAGLDKTSLRDLLVALAPEGSEEAWRYGGNDLTRLYQWLGGGHGSQAHPLAANLLAQVALGRNEAPLDTLRRHLADCERSVEDKLLGDLYENVLTEADRKLLSTLCLYLDAIPHDHAERLEKALGVAGAWLRLRNRCILSSDAREERFFLHGFVVEWQRHRLGYALDCIYGRTLVAHPVPASALHQVIAECWSANLAGSKWVTLPNIERAQAALFHLCAAGDVTHLPDIALELLGQDRDWVVAQLANLSANLHRDGHMQENRMVLEFLIQIDPNNHKAMRFLGECCRSLDGPDSPAALNHFARACELRGDFPAYWANFGSACANAGGDWARRFLADLEHAVEGNANASNDVVLAVKANCLDSLGLFDDASKIRQPRIRSGSRHTSFYSDEALSRARRGEPQEALRVVELATKNGCYDDYVASAHAAALRKVGRGGEGSELVQSFIRKKSTIPVLYREEAIWQIDTGHPQKAIEILMLAKQLHASDFRTDQILARAMQAAGDDLNASRIRRERMSAGTRDAAIYVDEAKRLLDLNQPREAISVLMQALKLELTDDHVTAVLGKALEASGRGEEASKLRMQKIDDGSTNPVLFSDEMKWLRDDKRPSKAIELFKLASERRAISPHVISNYTKALQIAGRGEEASRIRAEQIATGSCEPAVFNDEAFWLLECGKPVEAQRLMNMAKDRSVWDAYSDSVLREIEKMLRPSSQACIKSVPPHGLGRLDR